MTPAQSSRRPATDAVESALTRIAEADGDLHAFADVDRDGALAAAAAIDRRVQDGERVGPLAGFTVGVKDVIEVRGSPCSQGSRAYRDDVADADAAVVERLRRADAVIIGTTTCHELAYGPTGDVSFPHAAVNPHAPGCVPGGSSSGSAVATAAHLTTAAIGSDTGGSVRIPAACCGVSGLKPTRGLVSRYGMRPLAPSLDHVGVLARSAREVAAVLSSIAGYDIRDEVSQYAPGATSGDPDWTPSPAGVRIGVLRGHFAGVIDQEVDVTFRAGIDKLRELGAVVADVEVAGAQDAMRAQRTIVAVEARRTHADRLAATPDMLGPEVRARLDDAHSITLAAYLDAGRAAATFRRDLLAAFGQVDVLACPTLPILPPRAGQRDDHAGGSHVYDLLTRFTSPFNTVDVPAMSVPMGWSRDGRPIGIQLVASPFEENMLYRIATAVEFMHEQRRPVAVDQFK